MKITIDEAPVFQFETFERWISRATALYQKYGLDRSNSISVDGHGRICTCGLDFQRAKEGAAFPVSVFGIHVSMEE